MPLSEEEKAIKYICKHTGLSGIEAKHIYDALQQTGVISVYDIDWEQAISAAKDYGNRYEAVWNYLRDLYGISKPWTEEEIEIEEERAKEEAINAAIKYINRTIAETLMRFSPEEREEILDYLKETLQPEEEKREEIEKEIEEIKREQELREKIEEEKRKREEERKRVESRIEELEKKLMELLEMKEKVEKAEKSGVAMKIKEELEYLNPEFMVEVNIKNNDVEIVGYLLPEYTGNFHAWFTSELPLVVTGRLSQIEKLKETFTKYISAGRLTGVSMAHRKKRKEGGGERKGYYECWVCGYSCSPERAKELNYICPKCGGPLHPIR